MPYNTGNPVEPNGSDDPRDLIDNAKIADKLINSSDLTWPGRLGKILKTWAGIVKDFSDSQSLRETVFLQSQQSKENRFSDFLNSSGYQDIGVYGAGLILTERNQIFLKDGEFYSVSPSTEVPYTTTGVWVDESSSFVSVGDASLRQALATDDGSGIVGFDDGTQYQLGSVGRRLSELSVSTDMTIRIPSDFLTPQDAVDFCSSLKSLREVRVYIVIEAGHILGSGFRIVDKDLSFVTIISEDPVVTVSPSFNHVSNNDLDLDQVVARTDKIGFLAIRSKMPVWSILVDMAACPTTYGYVLNAGSYGYIRSSKGVKNSSNVALSAGSNIVVAGNSTLDAFHAVASGGLISGITVTHRSNANIAEIDASGTTGIGLDVSRGSMVYANLSVVSGRPFGIDGRRSFIAAQGVTFANCSSAAIRGSIGAKIVAVDAVITGSTPSFNYIMPEQGSDISVSNATVNGAAITAAHVYQSAGINKLTGRGIVTSQSAQDTHPTFFKSGTAYRQVSGSPSVTALSYATAFTRAEPGYFAGGVVFGDDVGYRLTCDGAVVIEDVTRVIGGAAKSVAFVPPFSFLASCTLEVYNRGGVTANVAYRLTEYR